MTKSDLYEHFFGSKMFKEWHWFRWHFEHRLRGENHPLAQDIVRVLLDCDQFLPGFAIKMADELAAICGREKYEPHREQLLQRMAEIHVIHQAVMFSWPTSVEFLWEPRLIKDGKNPELSVKGDCLYFGIEVKAPSLLEHVRKRSQNPQQLPARSLPHQTLKRITAEGQKTTLPRDNPIKDFLNSADEKFSGFRAIHPDFIGALIIVWDDFIYEPISSLLHPTCGLFTESTFFRTKDGQPVLFPNVNFVVLIRHLHQFDRASRDEPFIDSCSWTFDYGRPDVFPFKVLIKNPAGREVSSHVIECFQARPPSSALGAEYVSQDIVFWSGDES